MRDWFRDELKSIMPNGDLRLVRDPHRLGLDLWVVERKLPPEEHARSLEAVQQSGMDRFIPVTVPSIGLVKYDTAPEWSIVHVCKSDRCDHQPVQFCDHEAWCYREPNSYDLAALRRWLFEFRTAEDSFRAMREEREKREAATKAEANLIVRKELQSSHVFRQLEFGDAPRKVFKESPSEELIIKP